MNSGFRPLEIAFLRYFIAGIPLLIWGLWGGKKSPLVQWSKKTAPVDIRIALVGVITFFISPVCQMTGLSMSRAVDSALMIALEPLITIFGACLMLGERLRFNHILAVFVALLGVGVLTELTWDKFISLRDARLLGNLIFMIALVSEALYSIVAKPALNRRSPALFLTVSIWTGIILLFAYNVFVDGPERLAGLVPLLQSKSRMDWFAILFLGLFCTAFGYLYWMQLLHVVPLSLMALTLYIQPVLGMVWGHLFLDEVLSGSTYLGAVLILGAVWLGSRTASGKPAALRARAKR